jgi:hypothetical protein
MGLLSSSRTTQTSNFYTSTETTMGDIGLTGAHALHQVTLAAYEQPHLSQRSSDDGCPGIVEEAFESLHHGSCHDRQLQGHLHEAHEIRIRTGSFPPGNFHPGICQRLPRGRFHQKLTRLEKRPTLLVSDHGIEDIPVA